MNSQDKPLQIAVMVGGHGRGSNLQAILDACASGEIAGQVSVVVGTRSDAPAIERARAAGTNVQIVSPKQFDSYEGYGQALLTLFTSHEVGLICLAGYMRILPQCVVDTYRHRILNVHPALLPLFGGKGMYGEHVHRAVLASGMKVSGCTVHVVDEEYDTGPIVVQTCVPVLEDDTWETLAARVLPEEHRGYVRAIRLFAQSRITVDGRHVRIRETSESR